MFARSNLLLFFFFFFFKERLGLKLTHKRITTKVVLPVSKGKGAIQGEVKMCKEGVFITFITCRFFCPATRK